MRKSVYRKANAATRSLTNLRMYGEIVGRRLGITIRPGDISTGCTDGKTITVNFAAFSDDPDAVVLLDGTCTHEFGHVRYTDFLAKLPIIRRPVALAFYRSLEDGRMENSQRRDYPGMQKRIVAALEIMAKRGIFSMPKDDEPLPAVIANMLLGWTRSQYLGQSFMEPGYKARLAMACQQLGMPVVKGFLDIAKDGLARARPGPEGTHDIVKCAIALEEYLKQVMQSMESQQQQPGNGDSGESDQQDESGAGGESGSQDQDSAEGEDAGDPVHAEPDSNASSRDSGKPDSGEAQDGKEDSKTGESDAEGESRSQDPGETEGSGDGESESGQDDEDASKDSGKPEPSSSMDGEEEGEAGQDGAGNQSQQQGDAGEAQGSPSGSSGQDDGGQQPGTGTPSAAGPDDGVDQAIAALAQLLGAGEDDLPETDLGALLQQVIDEVAPAKDDDEIQDKKASPDARALEQYSALTRQIELRVASHLEVLLEARLEERSYIERAGRKLATRHLARVKTSPAPRVFRVDDEISGVSTAVSVLLDVSASMDEALADGYSRLHAAVASARAAVAAMDRHEVPCSMHFFGRYMTKVKTFEQPWRSVRDLHWITTEGGTLTGLAVERVVPQLATRDEERKLLLLVTDGYPANPDRTASALQTCGDFGVETAIMLINSGSDPSLDKFTKLLDQFGLSWIEVNTTDQLSDGLMQAIKDAV